MSWLKSTKITTPSTPGANTGLWYYDNTLSPARPTFMDENGTKWPLTPTIVKLTGDLGGTTSTTLANTTGLVFAVVSGTYYYLRFGVIWTTASATTTGIKIGLTTPTFTIFAATVRSHAAADGTAAEFEGALTTSGDSVAVASAEAVGTTYLAMVEAMILPSANGNVQVQHAAEAAAAGAVVVKQGSFGILTVLY